MQVYIFTFLSLVSGLMGGLWLGLIVLKPTRNRLYSRAAPERVRQRRWQDDETEESEVKIQREYSSSNNILKEKMKKPSLSILEFSNAADGIDHNEYVKRRQTREDAAYSVLKVKREHVDSVDKQP